ncbi:MAG: exosortase/archaeosortase family protein [Pirellulales bacterium]|nr:exosortase/archaeosortase family protein [Pirellulales bacterium]
MPHPRRVPDSLHEPSGTPLAAVPQKDRRLIFGGGVALMLAFIWSYAPTLQGLFETWSSEADYSHGFFVIPLAVFFLWLRRDRMPFDHPMAPSYAAVGLLAFALLLRLTGVLLYIAPLDALTIPIWLAGSVWLLCGLRWMFWSLPAIAFLFFMAPLPYSIESQLSYPLQSVATSASAWMLQVVGQPAVTTGNIIVLGENVLNVEEACSGLRMFLGISALAAAYCVIMRRPWWEKGIVVLSVLPVAVLANSLRIAGTGLCYQYFGAESSRKLIHDMAGFFVIFVAAAMMGALVWYLKKIFVEVESADVSTMLHSSK